uniref:ATP synthase CF0 B chain n=1 Tax=Welwitschia mirabilis TaxID=3377 RepID=B7ZI47_WELMI|nr:ATP synthase CF0 B chain [Welwitschia mirabilis]
MKEVINSLNYLSNWPSAGSFEFNTNILETNIINISVVLGVLVYFGKGVEKARARLWEVEKRVDEIRVNGYLQIEQEKENLIKAASANLKQLEDSKNETIFFEQQKVIDQVRQQISYQALQKALAIMNNCLNTDLHLRMIDYNIGRLRAKKPN